ncbi:MAG: hypothetical protein A3G87_09215 [Omnitrophica bacterium RIFCSPLOWO2_12_FULL_50_11]|nr:MAG: hypothetical protein A3G87_09215 [Omnitrophica bacterium RIFCSPLOWO2_12_FULL_50_11]
MSDVEAVRKRPNYAGVFWSLFILTILEIIAANTPFAKVLVVVTLVILALMKAGLVALYYMHLKFEKYVFYVIVFFPLLLAVILTVLVLADKAIA